MMAHLFTCQILHCLKTDSSIEHAKASDSEINDVLGHADVKGQGDRSLLLDAMETDSTVAGDIYDGGLESDLDMSDNDADLEVNDHEITAVLCKSIQAKEEHDDDDEAGGGETISALKPSAVQLC